MYLIQEKGHEAVYTRYVRSNNASRKMNEKLGFALNGASYVDVDGLEWQNVKYEKKTND